MSGQPSHAADPRLDSARAHSQEGDAYYKLEKYANAITEYEQAYLAKPDPSFLYNIAQCHRLMGQGPEGSNSTAVIEGRARRAQPRRRRETHPGSGGLRDSAVSRDFAPRDLLAPGPGGTGAGLGHPSDRAAARITAGRRIEPTRTHLNAGVDDASRRNRHHLNTTRVPADLL